MLTRLDDVLARIGWLGMDLVAQTARQVLEHQALRVESRTDPLTGVGNRRALDEELRHMLRFTPMPLALVLVDIDHFKQVNDAFTHVVGDEVLRRVAECLGRELRVGDHLARYGGDEFIALLPRTGDQEARQVAQRMSDAIARLPWAELADGLAVGVSTGSAALWSLTGRRPDRDAENLFRRADEALLEAKRRRAEGGAAGHGVAAPRRRHPSSAGRPRRGPHRRRGGRARARRGDRARSRWADAPERPRTACRAPARSRATRARPARRARRGPSGDGCAGARRG